MAGRRSPAPQACWTCLHVTHKPEARAKETAGEPSWCRKLPSLALQACVASGLEFGEERFSSRSRYTITPWPWRFGVSRYKPEAPAKEPCSSLMTKGTFGCRQTKALFACASGLCPETRRRASVAGGENFLRWRFRLVSQADKRALFAGASGVCRERTKGPLRLRFRLGCGRDKRGYHDE